MAHEGKVLITGAWQPGSGLDMVSMPIITALDSEARASGVRGYPQRHSEFKTHLRHMRSQGS